MNRFEKINLTLEGIAEWINDNVTNSCDMCKKNCMNGGTRKECIEGIKQWLDEDIEETQE